MSMKRGAVSPPPRQTSQQKPTIERDAFYGVNELRAITNMGRNTIYAILRTARDPYAGKRKYRITGADFLRLHAAYYGYTDAA